MISFFICMGTIAFTITVREDLGSISPRQHQRYYAPFWLPFQAILFDLLFSDNKKEKSTFKGKISYMLFTTAACTGILFFLKTFQGTEIDNTTLRYYKWYMLLSEKIPIFRGEYLRFSLAIVILAVAVLSIKNSKKAGKIIIGVILLIQLCNNITSTVDFRLYHGISKEEQTQANILSQYVRDLDGNILIIQGERFNPTSKILDTYLDTDYCVTNENEMYLLLGDKEYIDLNTQKIMTIYKNDNVPYSDYDHFDYIITEHNFSFADGTAEKLTIDGVDFVDIYKILSGNRLYFNN